MPDQTYVALLRQLAATASPAPWSHEHDTTDGVDFSCEVRSDDELVFARGLDYWEAHDLDLIVFLRNSAEEIATVLEKLRAVLDEYPEEFFEGGDAILPGSDRRRLRKALADLDRRAPPAPGALS